MTASDTKTCTDCGAEFKRSATDYTVRCMDCRAARRHSAGSATRSGYYEAKALEAKAAAYAARREFGYDSDEARAALAEYLHCKGMAEARA